MTRCTQRNTFIQRLSYFITLFVCKYCKMHFDIIDMFWYFSHYQWILWDLGGKKNNVKEEPMFVVKESPFCLWLCTDVLNHANVKFCQPLLGKRRLSAHVLVEQESKGRLVPFAPCRRNTHWRDVCGGRTPHDASVLSRTCLHFALSRQQPTFQHIACVDIHEHRTCLFMCKRDTHCKLYYEGFLSIWIKKQKRFKNLFGVGILKTGNQMKGGVLPVLLR